MTLKRFLSSRRVEKGEDYTHTAYGPPYGIYDIRGDDLREFMEVYKTAFEEGEDLHITEKHKPFSPCLVDMDFRQEYDMRIYDESYIVHFIEVYTTVLKRYVKVSKCTVYVLEKPNPRPNKSGGYKDGFHIVLPDVITSPRIQEEIRRILLTDYRANIMLHGVQNTLEDMYDEAVLERNNWLMYGSKKDKEEHAWKVTKVYEVADGIRRVSQDPNDPSLIPLLSIRYNKNEEIAYTEQGKQIMKRKVNDTCDIKSQYTQSVMSRADQDVIEELVDLLDLERADSYEKWIRVGWCLHNIDVALLSKWIDFSKKSSKYREGECEKLWVSMKDEGLGIGSLHRWAKEDSPNGYITVMSKARCNDDEVTIDDIRTAAVICDYSYVKRVFEKNHAKLMTPICYIEEEEEVAMRDESSLKKAYRNIYCMRKDAKSRFIDIWIDDPFIKTYKRLDFCPPPLKCPSNVYNMWKGFHIDKVESESSGDIEVFKEHCRLLTGYNEACYDYLIKWLAQLVQEPGKLIGIALIFISKEGAGKNIFLDHLMKILGPEYYFETASPDKDLFGRFSNGRKYKLVINLDETQSKDTFANSEVLKNMITSEHFNYEQKGVDPVKLRNVSRLIFTTNNLLCAKITDSTRRYVIFEVSNRRIGDKAYFKALSKYMEDIRNQKAIMEYLRTVDISTTNWIQDRPLTDTYETLRSVCEDPLVKYLVHFSKENEGEVVITSSKFYLDFKEYLVSEKVKEEYIRVHTERVFLLKMKEYLTTEEESTGIVKMKNVGKKKLIGYMINVGELKDYLRGKGIYIGDDYNIVDDSEEEDYNNSSAKI
jgi:hypothetical protein